MKFNLEEIKTFIDAQSPETKIYIGCDSERFRLKGLWHAHYTLVVVVHIDGKNSGPVLKTRDLVSSDDVFLAATGITDGELVHGIRYTPFGALSQSIVMRGKSKTVRIINTEHHLNQK